MAFEPVALIGMAGRFCGARDVDAFWDNIHRGVETIRDYSDEELLDEGVEASSLSNPQYVKAAGPIEDGDRFGQRYACKADTTHLLSGKNCAYKSRHSSADRRNPAIRTIPGRNGTALDRRQIER